MATRRDMVPWAADPRELPLLRDLSARGLNPRAAAERLNAEIHGGRPVRTAPAITNARATYGIKVGDPRQGEREPEAPPTQTVDVRDDGTTLHVTAYGSEVRTLDELIARAQIDLTRYEVDRPETSMHETTVRDAEGNVRKVQNFRIVARFKPKAGPSTMEAVEALIAGAAKTFTILRYPKHKGEADILQALCIFDPHIGKLAWPAETGSGPWDTPISLDTLATGVLHLMAEGDKRGVGERAFVIGGDYFHHDGKGMTTKGTVLDYDSRFPKMYRGGTRLLVDLIATSAATMPTRVYIVPGNHDAVLSFALQEALVLKFEQDKRVMVDERFTSTKFFQWGRCLIGLDHGDKGKKRLPGAMSSQCEVEWGTAIVKEFLTGHLHGKAAIQTIDGVVVRTMDSLATADKYHAEEKFNTSPRTIEAFRYHKGGMVAGTDSWSPDLNRAPRRGT